MGKRAWAITAVCGLLTVACGITAVVAAQHRSDAEDRQAAAEEQAVDTTDLQALRSELDAQHDTQARLDARAETLAAMFTPDAVNAVAQVQADALPGACALARTALRAATPPPNAESYAAYAVAAATNPALDGLPDRWGRMIDPTQIQAEIDRCATDEQAVIDAEEQRFCNEPLFPEDYCPTQAEIDAAHDYEGLVDACARGEQAACDAAGITFEPVEPHFGAIGPLVDACQAGDQAACDQLRAMGVPGV